MSGWQSAPLAKAAPSGSWQDAPLAAPVGQAPSIAFGRDLNAPPEETAPGDLGAGAAAASGFVRGLPVVGPPIHDWITELAAHLDAQPGVPADYLKGAMEARNALTEHEHPVAEKAGEIGGGITGYAGIGAMAPAVIGGGSLPLAARAVIAGAANAGIGAADTAARQAYDPNGDYKINPDDVLHSAEVSGLIGTGIPVAGKIVGSLVRPVARGVMNWFASPAVPGMRGSAANSLAEALLSDNAANSGVVNKLQNLGPDASLADAGPASLGRALGVNAPGATPGNEGRSLIFKKFQDRALTAPDRIQTDLGATVGPDVEPVGATKALKAQKAVEGAPLQQIFASAPPVDTTQVLSFIAQKMGKTVGPERAALERIKSFLMRQTPNGVKRITDAETLQSAKESIDTLIREGDPTLGIAKGALNKAEGAAKTSYSMLNQALRDQVPDYGDVMDKLASLNRQIGQIETGAEGVKTLHPDLLTSEWTGLPVEEQAAKRLGVTSDVYKKVGGSTISDRAALKGAVGTEDKWARRNLETIYGTPAAERLGNALDREATFAGSEDALLKNSMTAPRAQAAAEMNPAGDKTAGAVKAGMMALHPEAAIPLAGAWGLQATVRKIGQALTHGRNLDIAKAMVSGDPIGLAQALLRRGAVRATAGQTAGENASAMARALLGYEGTGRKGEDLPAIAKGVGTAALVPWALYKGGL